MNPGRKYGDPGGEWGATEPFACLYPKLLTENNIHPRRWELKRMPSGRNEQRQIISSISLERREISYRTKGAKRRGEE